MSLGQAGHTIVVSCYQNHRNDNEIQGYKDWAQLNKYKLCKHRANLATKVHFIATLTQSNNEDVEIYNTDCKGNIIIRFRLPIKVHIIHHT